jgi:hypothetical protein
MAIKVNAMSAVVKIQGDGTSTSVVLDLVHIPFTFDNIFPLEIVRADNLPTDVQSVILDNSSRGVSATLSGAKITISFTTAPTAASHTVNFTLSFPTV